MNGSNGDRSVQYGQEKTISKYKAGGAGSYIARFWPCVRDRSPHSKIKVFIVTIKGDSSKVPILGTDVQDGEGILYHSNSQCRHSDGDVEY